MQQVSGKLYLIPCPIVEKKMISMPQETLNVLHQIDHFIVERAKTARHYIKESLHPRPIAELYIHQISENKEENYKFLERLKTGINVAVLSEAGCPGIADPGAEMVAWAHKMKIKVVPLIGPSSIFLGLMSSGFSGQSFAFLGYLSQKKDELARQLKSLESQMSKTGQTQIFMEAPYRNIFLLETCIRTLQPSTELCLACDINSDEEVIVRQPIKLWAQTNLEYYHKRPCIYIIGK